MFDREQALSLLDDVVAGIGRALRDLDTIRKQGGEVSQVKKKRKAVRSALEAAEEQLGRLAELVEAADGKSPVVTAPDPEPQPDPGLDPVREPDPARDPDPDPAPEPEPDPDPVDLIPPSEQHAVSKLLQDTAVHLTARRRAAEWEIRHRNLPGGAISEPIRRASIAEAYSVYDQQAQRPSDFEAFEPRALSLDEQQALIDLWNIESDKPRSVRWEDGETFVDYVLPSGEHGSSKNDGVSFRPGELVAPVGHLKAKLG